MTKQQLENLDVVQCRNGIKFLYYGYHLIDEIGVTISINKWMDSLIHTEKKMDIMIVWRHEYKDSILNTLNNPIANNPILWKRPDTEYEMPEIEKMKDLVSELSDLLNIK